MWDYCQDVYSGHRQVALLLRERKDELVVDLEKIAESSFLMAVVFALAVTKNRLNSNFSRNAEGEISPDINFFLLLGVFPTYAFARIYGYNSKSCRMCSGK